MKNKINNLGLLKFVAMFLIVGIVWIILWQKIPFLLIKDVNTLATIDSIKPWASLILGSVLIVWLLKSSISDNKELIDELRKCKTGGIKS